MKFALIKGSRQEAQPNHTGDCPGCGNPVLAKCGETRIWHWAHKVGRNCDPWWENETEWHRAWKNHFPEDWQEYFHRAADGTRHIADIRTERGWIIEFQHSAITPEERQSRDAFYRRLIWVVDGTRRKRDFKQFEEAWNDGRAVGSNGAIRLLRLDDCLLLREWSVSQMPVFFDFGPTAHLLWLLPAQLQSWVYVGVLPRAAFIESHRLGADAQNGAAFDSLASNIGGLIAAYEQQQQRARAQYQVPGSSGVRPRRHFRF